MPHLLLPGGDPELRLGDRESTRQWRPEAEKCGLLLPLWTTPPPPPPPYPPRNQFRTPDIWIGSRKSTLKFKFALLCSGPGSLPCPGRPAPCHQTHAGSLSAAHLSPSSAPLSIMAHLYVGTQRCIRSRACLPRLTRSRFGRPRLAPADKG